MFVGVLLMISFAMWGKTVWEDAALNVAGMLLAVVALVPNLDDKYCTLPANVRDVNPNPDTEDELKTALILANAPEVHSNFFTYLVTFSAILVFVLIAGLVLYLRAGESRRSSTGARFTYGVTWLLAVLTIGAYTVAYQDRDDPQSFFNQDLHGTSANVGVTFVVVAVVACRMAEVQEHGDTQEAVGRYVCPAGGDYGGRRSRV